MKAKVIKLIYADSCESCKRVRFRLDNILSKTKSECIIIPLHYDTNEALQTCVQYNINTFPAFIIGKDIFIEEKFKDEDVIKSLNKDFVL